MGPENELSAASFQLSAIRAGAIVPQSRLPLALWFPARLGPLFPVFVAYGSKGL